MERWFAFAFYFVFWAAALGFLFWYFSLRLDRVVLNVIFVCIIAALAAFWMSRGAKMD